MLKCMHDIFANVCGSYIQRHIWDHSDVTLGITIV